MHFSPGLLIRNFTQASLYGLYIATLVQCIRWRLFADEGWILRKHVNWPIFIIVSVIFLLVTLNLLFSIVNLLNNLKKPLPDVPALVIMMDLSKFVTILIVEAVLIYRCWMVYVKSWRVVCPPALFWIGVLISSVLTEYYDASAALLALHYVDTRYYANSALRASTAICICSIATTAYSTGAISYRILRVTKANSNSSRLRNTVRILNESGASYCSMTLIILIAGLIQANNHRSETVLAYLISDSMSFSAAITFNLFIIRVDQNRIESADSFADSRNADGQKTLSRMQFYATTSEATTHPLSSNGAFDVSNGIQEINRIMEQDSMSQEEVQIKASVRLSSKE